MSGIEQEPALRKVGVYGYDSPPRYRTAGKVTVPDGLGIVSEYEYTKAHTDRPLKVTCPGPLTLTMHIRPREGYGSRLELAWEFAALINAELKALVEAGAEYIQLDEPSFAIIPGELKEWVALYNASVEGVDAKLALHVCFGNLGSRPRGKRSYRWMFPALLDANADQLVFEYANREMTETGLWKEFSVDRELGAGVIDIKSFYVEDARGRGRAHPRLPGPGAAGPALRQPRLRVLPAAQMAVVSEAGGDGCRRANRARRADRVAAGRSK